MANEIWQHLGRADKLEIDSDDQGFELRIWTDEGCYSLNIHAAAWDFAESVKQIQSWRAEGEAARGTEPPRITEEDLDAYPLGSPKRITLEREMERQK